MPQKKKKSNITPKKDGGKSKGQQVRETQRPRSARAGQGPADRQKDQQQRSTGRRSGGK